MEDLKKTVGFVVVSELLRANKVHGKIFNSPHEGYAVILEELQEAQEEIDKVNTKVNILWRQIRENKTKAALEIAETIKTHAILAACEAVQIAAMAQKFIDSSWEG